MKAIACTTFDDLTSSNVIHGAEKVNRPRGRFLQFIQRFAQFIQRDDGLFYSPACIWAKKNLMTAKFIAGVVQWPTFS